nr:hypothetical protein [Cytophagales bacterium]
MHNQAITEESHRKFEQHLSEFIQATPLMKPAKASTIMSQIDLLVYTPEGLSLIYDNIEGLTKGGIFEGSPWADPAKLVASLVNGTLKSGHPNSTIEIVSELRLVAISNGKLISTGFSQDDAENFIQEVIVANLEFVFNEPLEDTRLVMSEHELQKVHILFKFIATHTKFDSIKEKLADELTLIC